MITYILVRNIQGILEILLFSRVKLSQGTPYTITTLLTYILVCSGWRMGIFYPWDVMVLNYNGYLPPFPLVSVLVCRKFLRTLFPASFYYLRRPIRVGDTVTINDVTGTVAKIRIRAITMIDPDRKEVIVPNKSFVTGQVTNWALSNTVTRLVVSVGVAYGSDLDLVKRLLLQAAHEQPSVLKDPEPRALFF